ncbi:cytochrome c biogenesis CcdA family protein [Candidatus Contubernalis alkaliaceticus]|uniref:cytochrome c biogenesis CcdA family protein n=1 Tax=Candidatus Contubernalis alkaliaceticus TaxID=338645 RepID=UPI001F4BEDB4|nr:cytochrome c biogenesis protein CcdA [Candidatus Contubernalis alkalaceticus]UNC93088.1 hypothetical protein HUE98_13905 [Candidatus Contubernalis alkalaceticus]
MQDLNILIAFTAGILSFFSPCILPLIPVYLTSMGAWAFQAENPSGKFFSQGRALLVSVSFILGFTLVFVIMGASIGFLGKVFLEYRQILYRTGGLLVIFLGLKQLGLMKVSFLERSWKISGSVGRTSGLMGAFALGAIFSIGWSPCVGPVLAGILLLSLAAPSPFTAAGYLFVYSMGFAVPFIIIALFLEGITGKLMRLNRYLPYFNRAAGLLLIIIGGLLVSGL